MPITYLAVYSLILSVRNFCTGSSSLLNATAITPMVFHKWTEKADPTSEENLNGLPRAQGCSLLSAQKFYGSACQSGHSRTSGLLVRTRGTCLAMDYGAGFSLVDWKRLRGRDPLDLNALLKLTPSVYIQSCEQKWREDIMHRMLMGLGSFRSVQAVIWCPGGGGQPSPLLEPGSELLRGLNGMIHGKHRCKNSISASTSGEPNLEPIHTWDPRTSTSAPMGVIKKLFQ
ncbi:uncharacterized protein LOC113934156 [Zalophus californianus]|uniref:Uncharacterized protein LOC113934156 n=1 Tax=Zalophus californianus TaxID=9704 RepID=A0A6J2ENB9_ZALCA|nr:uncharacterized protein LOC113934156 [Zalophus californianus]